MGLNAGLVGPRGSARVVLRVGLVFLIVGPVGWLMFAALFSRTPGQDWMVFDTAVQAWRRGDIGLLLDGHRFTGVLNATHAAWLGQALVFHPWVYPPYTLLLALPFCLLPFGASYIGFQALSFAGLALAVRPWIAGRARYALVLGGLVLCPATAFTLGAGQNSFFTASLIAGGVFLLRERPILAGVLFGLLGFKPQFAVLVPVALLACGAWRALLAAAATGAVLLVLSLAAPGPALWAGWLHLFLSGDPAFHTWVNEGRINGQSVFSCLAVLGAPPGLANAGQVLAIAVSGICVWLAFRGARPPLQRLIVLLCATILAAPHVGAYDGVLLGLAAVFVLQQSLYQDLRTRDGVLAAIVWASTALNPPHMFAMIPGLLAISYVSALTPLAVGALMIRQLR
jgi:alpha-1,2-mannosyltransferase